MLDYVFNGNYLVISDLSVEESEYRVGNNLKSLEKWAVFLFFLVKSGKVWISDKFVLFDLEMSGKTWKSPGPDIKRPGEYWILIKSTCYCFEKTLWKAYLSDRKCR